MPGCKEDTTWSVMGDYWYLPGRKLTVTDGDWSQTFQEYCLRVSYPTLNHTANGIAPQSFCGSDERWKLTVKNPVVKKCSCCNHRIVSSLWLWVLVMRNTAITSFLEEITTYCHIQIYFTKPTKQKLKWLWCTYIYLLHKSY